MHEMKKIAKIVQELTNMFLHGDTNKFDLTVDTDEEKTVITLIDYDTILNNSQTEYLDSTFKKARQPAIEEYYWQLMGEESEDGVTLISMMTDAASVEKRDGDLYITLVRFK